MRIPAKPPREAILRSLEKRRAKPGERLPRDGFLRETFALPREQARAKAREWLERWPKQAYWTEVESWAERPGDIIEFTMRRLPSAD